LGGGNPFGVNLESVKNGNVNFPAHFPDGKDFKEKIKVGSTNININFTPGNVKESFHKNPSQSGYLLGFLFARGYEAGEIGQDTNGNLLAYKHERTPISGGFAGLLVLDKEND